MKSLCAQFCAPALKSHRWPRTLNMVGESAKHPFTPFSRQFETCETVGPMKAFALKILPFDRGSQSQFADHVSLCKYSTLLCRGIIQIVKSCEIVVLVLYSLPSCITTFQAATSIVFKSLVNWLRRYRRTVWVRRRKGWNGTGDESEWRSD